MKRRFEITIFFTLLCLVLMLTGCAAPMAKSQGGPDPSEERRLTPEERAERMMARMTIGEKLGQLMMVGVHGTSFNDDMRFMLSEYDVGGIILFDRNLENADEIRKLTGDLQENRTGSLPLLIAVDEEGGAVARMRDIVEPPPSQEEIGASGDPALARRWARYTAQKLKALGFNVNFAPVADLGTPRGRSYADDAETVTAFLREAAEGYAEEHFLCTLKHFPGLGKGAEDPHFERVVVNADKETLLAEDVAPFRAMIGEGNDDRFMVMASHLIYTAYDPERPASLSPVLMTELLRDELGYRGIVVTDDLEMGAAREACGFDEMGVRAIEAGADILLVCHEYEHEAAVYNGVLKAIRSGRIPEARIDASVRRVLRAKLALEAQGRRG
ncbi:MAG: glycoside hydrolase family 3 protein [Schwartzia sp.]|nr:glycoside hydrolase family 3 protein [Schwartzia sp. (in: firmicutes)]